MNTTRCYLARTGLHFPLLENLVRYDPPPKVILCTKSNISGGLQGKNRAKDMSETMRVSTIMRMLTNIDINAYQARPNTLPHYIEILHNQYSPRHHSDEYHLLKAEKPLQR